MTSRAPQDQDQVNWPYPSSPYYHPRNYLNPPPLPYPPGRVCNAACCRRVPRAGSPVQRHPYATHPPPHHFPSNLPRRSTQDNFYSRPPPLPPSQVSSFVPVNPFLAPHRAYPQHHPPQQPQSGVHRPIPQGRFDYNDYHHQYSKPSTSHQAPVTHQGFHPVIKPNSNSYGVNNQSHVSSATLDQFVPPNCSLYSNQNEQEPSLPNLDLRKFLSTWQDKDDDVSESDQPAKAKPHYQESPQNQDVPAGMPLDCTKKTDSIYPLYGYNHNQLNNHHNLYNKPLQGVGESTFHNPSYIPAPVYGSVSSENECGGFNPSQVSISSHGIIDTDPQHVGYERRIEKIYNPHSCKPMTNMTPSEPSNHFSTEEGNKNLPVKVAPTMAEKNQYHLSASLECEDLFDDINRRKEDRQRNLVHPLVYQENYNQRPAGRPKMDIPLVSVKPNTAAQVQMGFTIDNFSAQNFTMDGETDARKIKALPFKKWVQKRRKTHDELFNPFTMDFSSRDTVIERLHMPPSCEQPMQPMPMSVHADGVNSSIVTAEPVNSVPPHLPGPGVNGSLAGGNDLSEPIPVPADENYQYRPNVDVAGKPASNACVYSTVARLIESEPQIDKTTDGVVSINDEATSAIITDNVEVDNNSLVISSDDIDLNLASSCDLNNIMDENACKGPSPEAIPSYLKLQEDDNDNSCLENEVNLIPILETSTTEPFENEKKIQEIGGIEDCSDILGDSSQVNEIIIHGDVEESDNFVAALSDRTEETLSVTHKFEEVSRVSEKDFDPIKLKQRKRSTSFSTKVATHLRNKCIKQRGRLGLRETWRIRNRLSTKYLYHSKTSVGVAKLKKKWGVRKQLKIVLHASIRSSKVKGMIKANVCSLLRDCNVEGNVDTKDIHSKNSVDLIDDIDLNVSNPPIDLTVYKEVSVESTRIDGNSNVVPCERGAETDLTVSSVTGRFTGDLIVNTTDEMDASNGSCRSNHSNQADDVSDRILDGILNWPHHEEEIASTNVKESLKVSLPWGKIFNDETDIPEEGNTLSIGPAKIEFRYTPPDNGQIDTSGGKTPEKMSCVYPVKQVLVKRYSNPSIERVPKMVIKKTVGEEYKSYIKDANLRVVSIKNPGKDGQAEVIIESDRPLTEAVAKAVAEVEGDRRTTFVNLETNEDEQSSDMGTSALASEMSDSAPDMQLLGSSSSCGSPSDENVRRLYHCLLCQESLPSMEDMRSHENSLSHRHIDIVQRGVLHRLQESNQVPKFQPLTATEIEYLKWKPSFPGYVNHYFNKPL